MLEHSFCHLPGVGAKTERRLWSLGVHTWEDLMASLDDVLPASRRGLVEIALEESLERLEADDADYFADRLPASESWRLFSRYRNRVAYLDIETTGAMRDLDHITTIAVYDGIRVSTYVHGRNLEVFEEDAANYGLLVTFNGKSFDAPIIERSLRIRLPRAHIDLRHLLASLGYKGGLKACEKLLGIGRDDLDGVDGYFAVLLWEHFRRTGDERFLETLLAYNVADTVNLERLLVTAHNRKLEDTPFYASHALEMPALHPETPHLACAEAIREVRAAHGLFR